MGFIEIISMNEDGVTVKNLSELTESERLDLELDIVTGNVGGLLCVTCYKPIPSGMGHSYCEAHKPNFKSCEECNKEMTGLYCFHCYTGRILTSPSGERYLEHR